MLYYVWNETRYTEYWGVTDSPRELIKSLVDLYNSNCSHAEYRLSVEEFIEEYPDGYVTTFKLGEPYDHDYNSPIEKSSNTFRVNSKSWKEIWYGK